MDILHPQFLIDECGVPHGVVLEMDEFRRLLESAGIKTKEFPSFDPLKVADLGWTREEIFGTRTRLRSFEEDWDAPGMDAYDRA